MALEEEAIIIALGLLCALLLAVTWAITIAILRRGDEARAAAVVDSYRALLAVLRERCQELRTELGQKDKALEELHQIVEELHAARYDDSAELGNLRLEVFEQQLTQTIERAQEAADSIEDRDQQLLDALTRVEELSARVEAQLAEIDGELWVMKCRALEVADEVSYVASSQRDRDRGSTKESE